MNETMQIELVKKSYEELQEMVIQLTTDKFILQSKIDKAIEYIEKSMNNSQPFYEYLFGDENGKVENLNKLLDILKEKNNE
jgi:protein-tyrosine phosphatase